jgi:hypothetical protein
VVRTKVGRHADVEHVDHYIIVGALPQFGGMDKRRETEFAADVNEALGSLMAILR